MPELTFVSPAGIRRSFNIEHSTSAMAIARLNNVSGIEAECGGALSCGTCHVYVDPADAAHILAATPEEEDMLELVAAERRPTSRLCCQISLSADSADLTLNIPDTQF